MKRFKIVRTYGKELQKDCYLPKKTNGKLSYFLPQRRKSDLGPVSFDTCFALSTGIVLLTPIRPKSRNKGRPTCG